MLVWLTVLACGGASDSLPGSATLDSPDLGEQLRALEALKRPVFHSWPAREGCPEVRAHRERLVELARDLPLDDPRMPSLRYLALQCGVPRVLTALAATARTDWPSFEAYQAHCRAGGAARDPRCLAAYASVRPCARDCEARPMCQPLCGWSSH